MTDDLDLTEAIDALTAHEGPLDAEIDELHSLTPKVMREIAEDCAEIVAAVVVRRVRERIAADIRDMPDRHDNVTGARRLGYEWGRADAIYVARGGGA